MSHQKPGPASAGTTTPGGESIEDAARDLVRAVEDEPVSERLRQLARDLGRALDRRLTDLEQDG